MPKLNLFTLLPEYLDQQGEHSSIYDFKEYDDHIAVILQDFRKLIIPKRELQAIHDAAQKVEEIAAAVTEITETLLTPAATTTNDDAGEKKPPKRGKK